METDTNTPTHSQHTYIQCPPPLGQAACGGGDAQVDEILSDSAIETDREANCLN